MTSDAILDVLRGISTVSFQLRTSAVHVGCAAMEPGWWWTRPSQPVPWRDRNVGLGLHLCLLRTSFDQLMEQRSHVAH